MPQVQEFREIIINQQFDLASFSEAAQRYEQAKARLLAAQEEKMEATAEMLARRAVLAGYLEAVWPGPVICLETEWEMGA